MSDPRNAAHDKKVQQEKAHHEPAAEAEPKTEKGAGATGGRNGSEAKGAGAEEKTKVEHGPGEHEKSVTVLSKLKEMEFHSRANIETLAGLTLTIDDELKQREFSDPIGALYSAQDGFQTQIATLIASYEAKCDSMKPTA